jgi:uncharacterized protein with NRDE domain
MCVLYIAYEQHPDHPLILLANRDELYARPTAAATFWDDDPEIYAGRDLQGGGTWLGVSRGGRFAAVTNYRDPSAPNGTRSRGTLVADFLRGGSPPLKYLQAVQERADDFAGFNLIVGELSRSRREAAYFSNRGDEPHALAPGIYGLSNHLLDTSWPKVISGKTRFRNALNAASFDREACFTILADRNLAEDDELPSTGVPYETEKAISAIFIETPGYGTRCSTLLTFDNDLNWKFDERTWV